MLRRHQIVYSPLGAMCTSLSEAWRCYCCEQIAVLLLIDGTQVKRPHRADVHLIALGHNPIRPPSSLTLISSSRTTRIKALAPTVRCPFFRRNGSIAEGTATASNPCSHRTVPPILPSLPDVSAIPMTPHKARGISFSQPQLHPPPRPP